MTDPPEGHGRRLIVARFDHPIAAHAARRRLTRSWPSVEVEITRGDQACELHAVVDDDSEGPALYELYRSGADLEADLPLEPQVDADRP